MAQEVVESHEIPGRLTEIDLDLYLKDLRLNAEEKKIITTIYQNFLTVAKTGDLVVTFGAIVDGFDQISYILGNEIGPEPVNVVARLPLLELFKRMLGTYGMMQGVVKGSETLAHKDFIAAILNS